MAIPPVTGNNSDSANNTTINNLIRQVNNEETTKIIKDATGVRRVLIGSGANGFEGIKVSKPTIDVYTAANADLAFNSEQNVLKVVQTGTTTIPAHVFTAAAGNYNINQTSATVAHNLGYVPIVLAFANNSGFFEPITYSAIEQLSSTGFVQRSLIWSADSSNLYLFQNSFGFNYTANISATTVKYYLLQETAN